MYHTYDKLKREDIKINRNEAVAICKEIMNLSENMSAGAFNLALNIPQKGTPKFFEIRITMTIDAEIRQKVTNIAKKHGVAIQEEKEKVIVYEPKP